MEYVKQFLTGLSSCSGSNDKIAYLSRFKDDSKISEFLNYMFNPFCISNLSTKKLAKQVTVQPNADLTTFSDCLYYAFNTSTGKDIDVANINTYINRNLNNAEFIRNCISKQLSIGVSYKSINKAFGREFIPEIHLQLANKYFDNINYVEGKHFVLTLKLDGIRCIAIKRNGKVNLITRNGMSIDGAKYIMRDLTRCSEDNFVLDGELLTKDWKNLDNKSAYKAASKEVRKNGAKLNLSYVVFDMLNIRDWDNQKNTESWSTRHEHFLDISGGFEHIEAIPIYYTGNDTSKILDVLEAVKLNKQEGVMLNIMSAPYQFKRTKDLLKVKVMSDCDLRVVDVQEGRGKYTGTLGALVVEYKGNTVNVGSGFSDVARDRIWRKREKIIGRVIKVQYFEETQDAKGNKSLRFPVFVEVCYKGKEPSLY